MAILDNKASRLFFVLGGFFLTNAIIAEFVGIKIFSLEKTLGFQPLNLTVLGESGLGFNMTAGVMLWPIIFIMTDLINEYFGKRGVKILSYATVAFILYAFIMVFITIQLVPNEWWDEVSGVDPTGTKSIQSMNLAYEKIFNQGLWIIVGSMVAFLVGQIVDVTVFQKIKKLTGEDHLWARATGSTLISQFIDSFVVLFIAFYIGSDWPLLRVLAIGFVNYIYKFIIAIVLTPLLYIVHHWIDRYLGDSLALQLKNSARNEI